jgi:Icc-related predicted phosphoesterase
MKILYTSDLHGDLRLYQELWALARSSSADIIALGGDLLPSFSPTKRYDDMIPYQKTFVEQSLLPLFAKITETTAVKKILTIPGNWDLGYPFLFEKPLKALVDLSQRAYRLENGYELIGYPFVPPTPFRPKDYEKMDDPESPWPPQKNPSYIRSLDRLDQINPIDPAVYLRQRETIAVDLADLAKPIHFKRAIYVMHSPPFGARLDLMQGGEHAGSRSIAAFVERNQPHLTLHGHIHESPEVSGAYFDRTGETLSINPGQLTFTDRGAAKLSAVVFEVEDPEKTLTHTLYSGRSE